MQRCDQRPASDSSLVPTNETVLDVLALASDANGAVVFPTTVVPLVLEVYSDQIFYEGEAAPDTTKAIPRAAGTIHYLPVSGRLGWNFKRVPGGSATNIRMKLLGAS